MTLSSRPWSRRILKTILIVVVLLLVFAGAAFALFHESWTDPRLPAGNETSGEPRLAQLDSDGDGLKDWEEAIFRTDPHNPDTDGDGTPDEEEIVANRDPLTPGPDDLILPNTDQSKRKETHEALTADSVAGNLTRTILFQMLEARGAGFFDQSQTGAIAQELVNAMLASKNKYEREQHQTVADADIVILQTDDPESIKQYFNAMAAFYQDFITTNAGFPSDFDIIARASETKDPEALKDLARLATFLDALTARVKAVPVPRPVLELHKQELSLLLLMRQQINTLMETNPADAFAMIILVNLRVEAKKAIGNLHRKEIPLWLITHGITFEPDAKARLLYPLP